VVAGDGAEAVFAHGEAEQHYRTALELAREQGDLGREAEVLQKLGSVLRILTRYEEALEALDRAAHLHARASDHEGQARTLREIGWVHNYRGTFDRGAAHVQVVIERLEGLPEATVSPRAFADLYSGLAICLWPTARYTEHLAAAERAGAMARAANAAPTLCVAETLRGLALTMIGTLPHARRVLEEAIAVFDEEGDPWWLAQLWAYLGIGRVDEGDLRDGLRCLQQSRRLLEGTHDPAELTWIMGCIGEVLYLRGDWSAARSAYDQAIELGRGVRSDRYLGYVLLHRGELLSAEGNWKQASRDIDNGLEVASRCPAVPARRKGPRLLAERDVIEGHPQWAVDRLQPLLDQATGDWPRAFPPPVLAEAYLELGDVKKAEELVLQRVQRFQAQNHRRALAVWLRVQGMILTRQRQWKEADRAFTEAASLAQAMPYPYAEGRILYEYGQLHLRRGEAEQARDRLTEALAIFCRLGARKDVERTEQALDRSAGSVR
jgi:tetratricopeptide (TPR) repeat protein